MGVWALFSFAAPALANVAGPNISRQDGETPAEAPETAGLRLATFDIDATPRVGMPMAYDTVRRVDELGLRCRGIVILGSGQPMVLCAVDWIGIGNEGHDHFRQVLAEAAGTTAQRVAVHTLHQHDAPRFDASAERLLMEAGVSDLGSFHAGLAREVLQRLGVAVRQGLRSAVPIDGYGVGVAQVEKVASNRRILGPDGKVRATRYTATRDPELRALPEGVIDPELTSLVFFNGQQPVAVLSYYACHPQSYYRTGVPSPDFPGIARWMHSQDLPDPLHVHFNGAGGNLGAGKYNDGSPPNRLILAGRVADGMRRAYQAAERKPLTADQIDWRVEPVHLPVAEHLDAAALRANLPRWRPNEFFGSPDRLAFWLRCQSGQALELSCLRVGSARVLHMPGELFVEYQLAAKAQRPDLTVAMAAYGDYGPGYIGTAAAYEEGGYETQPSSSNVGPGSEAVLMEGIRRLLTDEPTEPDYEAELPRIPPREPDQVLESFVVADGFEMQLVAAEPMIGSPVAMQWDEHGDLYVCEMRGYSEHRDDRLSRITRLRDLDGNGVYDESQVFVDQLHWPTALYPYDGGWFVVDAPDLLFFRDTTGDGRADQRRVVLTGFGLSNVQGLANSFRWGLDNCLHLACSSNGGQLREPAAEPDQAIDIRGRDLAFDPRTGRWWTTPGAAQHGMAFDDWGRKFVCSNSDHIQHVVYDDHYLKGNDWVRPAPLRVSIAADGPQAEVFRISPVEPWRILRTRLRVSGLVAGPIEGGGRAAGYFTGATGLNIYRGDAYPVHWRGDDGGPGLAVVGDVGGNLIHRKKIDASRLPFQASRIDLESEWVASHDIWFRPAQFENGPDGTLHVIDVYREVIEHPHSLPPEIKRHLDLNSGRDRGRIYRLLPPDFQPRPTPRLAEESLAQWVALLEHPNAWHRETAARLLYQQQDAAAIPLLRQLFQSSREALGRMHALYALAGLGSLTSDLLEAALRDPHPQVRRHAVRLAERHGPHQEASEPSVQGRSVQGEPAVEPEEAPDGLAVALFALAQDPNWEVRRQVAFSLGRLPVSEPGGVDLRLQALLRILELGPVDDWLITAVHSAMPGLAARCLAHPAMLESPDAWPVPWLVALIDQASAESQLEEMWTVAEAWRAVLAGDDSPVWLPVAAALLRGLERKMVGSGLDSQAEGAVRQRLEQWQTWLSEINRQAVVATKAAVERVVDRIADQAEAVGAEIAQSVDGEAASRDLGLDAATGLDAVLPQIAALAQGQQSIVVPALLEWLHPRFPLPIQRTAVDSLSRFPSREVGQALIAAWETGSPGLRQRLGERLFTQPLFVDRLLAAIENGQLNPQDLERWRLETVAQQGQPELRRRAAVILAAWQLEDREGLIERFRQAMPPSGQVQRGRAVFRQHCAACHQLEGVGFPLGPSLADLGSKGVDYLLTHVLDPNREVNPQYLNYLVVTDDGRTLTGMIADESAAAITLQRGEGQRETVRRAEIEAIRGTGKSIMPDGLERSIDPHQMADLLEYLLQVL